MAHLMLQNEKCSAGVSCLIATQRSILNLKVCLQKLPGQAHVLLNARKPWKAIAQFRQAILWLKR